MALSAKQLERGKALWEDARSCTEGKGELDALRAWAQQCCCAEADRLLAKALLHVAVNRMISWATENLRKLHSLSTNARKQMEVTLEFEVVGLLNEALGVATRGARDHNSLQCFYLGCLIAHAVRGRANYVHMASRVSHLRRLDAKRREWASAPASAPWADPGAERVIGERAPFEADARHATAWAAPALQLGGQRLEEALRDERACMDHISQTGRPLEPKSSSPHAMVFDAAASLPMRLTLLHELVPEQRRREWSGLLATGSMRIAGGSGTGKHDAQHKMSQHAAQSIKLQQAQLKLREQRERRMLEAAAAAATAAGSGGVGGSSGGTAAALEKPKQEDLRRYLERRLQDAAAAAADPGRGGRAKGRPKKPPPGLQPPGRPAATAAVAAVQSLARVPLAELATAATRLGEQGTLPQQTVKRVKELVGRLAAKDSDSPRGAAGGGTVPRLRSGRMYCFPPPEGPLALAPAPTSRPAGLGSGPGLSQRGKHGQQAEQGVALCELPTADALTAYLHASYLGESQAAQTAAEPAVESLLDRLPGVRRLLDSLPRHKRGLQVLRGDQVVAEPMALLPHPGGLAFQGRLAQDVAFVKLALRGPHQGGIPPAKELLAAVKTCAPALDAKAAGLGSLDHAAAGWGHGGSEVFRGADYGHLRGHFTPLDFYAFKCTALWLPVADSAIDTARIFPHSSDASFPRQVTALAKKIHPGEPRAQATLSRMLLGASMLRALQSRREGHAGGPQEDRIDTLLHRPLLDKPEELLGLLGMDADVALALHAAADDIVRVATEGEAAGGAAPAGSDSLLSAAAGGVKGGTMEPPVVQVAAAALLASVLARQPPGARFKMDQLNAEREELAASVLAGVQQLLRRQRLTQLAARTVCDFVRMALAQAGRPAPAPASRSLPAYLECLGGLPLVALAQLAAFVYLLVGRSFLELADLDPEAFQDLAGGRDFPAELAGCDIQLTDRGLAELLGVPLLAEPGPPGGDLRVARASSGSGSGSELQLVRDGSDGGGAGLDCDDAAAQQLLPQAAQRLAAYAASNGGGGERGRDHGGGGERGRDHGGVAGRQRGRTGTGDGSCSWTEVLSALQQQAFLTGVLLDLRQWLDTTRAQTSAATSALDTFNMQAVAASKARGKGAALGDASLAELQGLVAKVTSVLPQSMLAHALAGHAWASLDHLMHSSLARQCEEGDALLGRRLQARQPSRPDEPVVEGARAQLRVFRTLELGHVADLERKLELTEHMAERKGAAFVQEQILHVLGPYNDFLRQHEAAQGGGRPGPSAQLAEQASLALLHMSDRVYCAMKDVSGMQEQLNGLLDCFHLRTQLLLSELHARCRVHPPSELMGLALREVLPLQWQQEWRRMQENSSEALIAELLAEEEEQQQQRERKKTQKAAKKAQKKGGGSEAASTSAASTGGDPEAEAAAGGDEEAPTQRPSTTASAAPSAASWPGGDGDELLDSWEGLPQTAAEAMAAAERGVPLPPGYVRMLQQLEAEEREEGRRLQQDEERAAAAAEAEAAAAAAAADAAADQAQACKKKRKKKKKDRGSGDAADALPAAVATAEQEEEEGGEWQAVAKKGPRRQLQGQQQQGQEQQEQEQAQQQQAQQQQAQQQQQVRQQQAPQASGARVLTVRRNTVQSAAPPTPCLPQPPTPPPGLQAQPQAKEPPQHARQQQARQAEQTARLQPPPAPAQEPTRHPVQQAHQGQPALGSLWQEPQPQLHPGAATFGSGLPGELSSLPDDLDRGPVRRGLSADAQPFSLRGMGQPSPPGHALFSAPPGQPSHASHSLFSQPLLGEQQPMQVQLPAQAQHPLSLGPPPDQLPGGLPPSIDPHLPRPLSPLPGGQPQPAGSPAQQPQGLPLPGAFGAVAEEDDSTYLQWLGVAEGQASPLRIAGTAWAGAAAAGSPPYVPGQQLRLPPPPLGQLDGLLLERQLPALPGDGLGGMQQQPVGFASTLQQAPQAAHNLAEVGGSLFSAPLAARSPPRPQPQQSLFSVPEHARSPARPQLPGFLQAADLPAAALLQHPAAPEPQPLGLGAGFGIGHPALDPATLAAAAAAAKLGGTAREPAPLLTAHLPQQPVQQAQQPPALISQQQPTSVGAPVGLGTLHAQQAQQGLALPPQHDVELDSLYQMLGVSDGGQAPAAAEAWATAAAHPHPSAASSGVIPVQAPAAPLHRGGGAAGLAAGQLQQQQQQQQTGGEPENGLGLAGLRNDTGEHNCFLNVIVQCLWRCAEFRQQVLAWDVAAIGRNHVARALQHLFRALQLAAASGGGAPVAVDPSDLREALAVLPNQLFRLGEMSDAGETLLSMFEQVREASPGTQAILDLLFGLKVAESASCSHCGAVTHKNAYTQFFYNTRASALRRVIAQVAEGRRRGIIGPKTLGARLRAIEEQVHKSCDTDHGGCNRSVPVTTWLEAAPWVFSLQIAWQSNTESPADIAATLAAVDERLDLAEVYRLDARAGALRYSLRSMVCYYGQHYQALVLVPEAGGWLMFDDTRVARVGGWDAVRRKCEAGRLQPSVLFYEAD